jgi:hypothetical protein
VEVLLKLIILNVTIRGKSDQQECSETEMLMLTGTIAIPPGPLCMRGVRQITVEEEMDHSRIGRPFLNKIGIVAVQHLDSVRNESHLHDYSQSSEELLDMDKGLCGALAKLPLKSGVDNPELIKDLPDFIPLAKGEEVMRRERLKPTVHDIENYDWMQSEVNDGILDVVQSNIKFASLKEQLMVYDDISNDDSIDYHDVEVGHGSPKELAVAI